MLYKTPNPHGGDTYSHPDTLDFSANLNPLGTPNSVRKAAEAALSELNRYPDPYCRRLVQAISRFEGVEEEVVLCGCGAAELIYTCCAALKPRRALELAPTFSEYAAALETVGCKVQRWTLKKENGFELDASFCSFLRQSQWDMVFLCNPNNPTGRLIDPELFRQIAEICRSKGIRLFVDECFLDFTSVWREQSLKPLLPDHPELLILKAFTKSYGMAGLRLGYCLCSDKELLSAMSRLVQPWNVSVPAQAAGVTALNEAAFLERTRRLVRQQRLWLQENLASLRIEVYPSSANYLLLYSPLPLWERLLEQGIAVRNCANYPGLGEGWIRIAVKRPGENQSLLAALQKILEAW